MTCINVKETLCKISGSLVHWKRRTSDESAERPPRSLGGHSFPEWSLNDLGHQE